MHRDLKIACVCMGNHDRSPLVMVMLAAALGYEKAVESFGMSPGIFTAENQCASDGSVELAQGGGHDLSRHRRRHFSQVDLRSFTHFVVATPTIRDQLIDLEVQQDAIFVLCEETGGLVDPHGKNSDAFLICGATIAGEIPYIIEWLRR